MTPEISTALDPTLFDPTVFDSIASNCFFTRVFVIIILGCLVPVVLASFAIDSKVVKIRQDVKKILDKILGIKSYNREEWEELILTQCRKALEETIESKALEEVEELQTKYDTLLADNKELEEQYSKLALESEDLKRKLNLTTDALVETQDRHDLLAERVKVLNAVNDDYSLLKNAYEALRDKLSQICDEDQRKGDF